MLITEEYLNTKVIDKRLNSKFTHRLVLHYGLGHEGGHGS